MKTAQLFDVYICLPKSQYFFTRRCTFWQALVGILSIIFTGIDTAIDDIITQFAYSIKQKVETMAVDVASVFYPKYGFA